MFLNRVPRSRLSGKLQSKYRLYKMKKFISLLLMITGFHVTACVSNSCLNRMQLLRVQKTNLSDISIFLKKENWRFVEAKTDQSFQYHEFSLNYDMDRWERSGYENDGTITLYYKQGRPNIVVFQSGKTGFPSKYPVQY